MKAILVHIGWVQNPKTGFCEMTEIAAMELQEIDGLVISGGKFHSYIRPVFQHWKLKRANHGQYSHWWLAPTYTQVMNDFSQWLETKNDFPWIVWSKKTFSVWQKNGARHDYKLFFPENVVYMKKELERINHLYALDNDRFMGDKEDPYSVKIVRELSQILTQLPLGSLKLHPLQQPIAQRKIVGKKETVVNQLLQLVDDQKVSIDEIAEWSGLSKSHILRIFGNEKKLNKFERERLMEAWTMWETVIDLRKNWLDS
ncbi:MAG: hypothetical protein LRY73_01110 [Bacillus sp. (in: Bacteria)]|nr:hypothetical protein [Bacillus sp. (in: firmicutes)]